MMISFVLNSMIGLNPSETSSRRYLTGRLTTFFELLPNYDRTYLCFFQYDKGTPQTPNHSDARL